MFLLAVNECVFCIVIITLDDPTILVSPVPEDIIVYNLISLKYYSIMMLFSATRIEFAFTVFCNFEWVLLKLHTF